MKKFFKTVAMMMALVMVIDAPVSAAGLGASDKTVEAVTVFEGEDKVAAEMTTDADDEGTGDKEDEGSHPGEDWGTGDGFDQPDQIAAVAIRGDKTINLEKLGQNSTKTLTADVIVNKKDFVPDVKWTVKGTAVKVEGDDNGKTCKIVAVHGGTATVTVTAGNGFGKKSDSVTVNVKEYTTNLKFTAGEYTYYLKNKIDPMDLIERTPGTANDDITFSVDNAKIATIDKNGFITMKKVTGATPIILTATTEKGVVATAKIKVEEGNPVTKFEAVGDKRVTADYSAAETTLKAKVSATKKGGATTDMFEWTSSKSSVVRVIEGDTKANASGDVAAKIKVVGVGKANVTVKASSGKKVTFAVTATANLKDFTITRADGVDSGIGSESNPILIYPKQKLTLLVTKDPSVNTTSFKKPTSTSRTAATISSVNKKTNTFTVTAKKTKGIVAAGEPFTVTLTCDDTRTGGKNVTKSVYFKLMPIDAASVVITSGYPSTLKVGEKVRFGATVKDSAGKTWGSDVVVWSSSSSKVLSIDADGYATALKAGKVKIKATTYDAKGKVKSAQSNQIEVKQPISSMSFKKPTVVATAATKKNVTFSVVLAPKGVKAARGQIKYAATAYDKNGKAKTVSGLVPDSTKSKVVVPNTMAIGDYIEVTATDSVDGAVTTGKILIVEKGVKLEADLSKAGVGSWDSRKKVLTVAPGTMVKLDNCMVQKDSKRNVITNLDQNQFPVTYTFSKKGIVSVDRKNGSNYGRLYAVGAGKVRVTAKLAGGAKTSFTIEVKNPTNWNGSQDGSFDGSFDGTGDAGLYEVGLRGIKNLKDSKD